MQVPTQAPVQTQGLPQPVSTTQSVPQAPQWQGKFALFQSTNPGARSQWSGRISLPAAEIAAIVHYLQTALPDQRGNVELWLTGFNNVSKAGLQYIGGYASPMQANQGLAVQHANNQLQQAQPGFAPPVALNPQQHPPHAGAQAFMQGAQPAVTNPASTQNPPF